MGWYKRMLEEQEEEWARGYRLPTSQHEVCPDHFASSHMREHIIQHGHTGRCHYCGKRTTVMDFDAFIDYVGGRIFDFIGPAENEALPLASSFIDKDDPEPPPGFKEFAGLLAPIDEKIYESEWEVLQDFNLVTDDEQLNNDIMDCFRVNGNIRRDPMGLIYSDELKFAWDNFCRLVKKNGAYPNGDFFLCKEYRQGAYGHGWEYSDIVSEVSTLVREVEQNIKVGTKLYRGRPDYGNGPFSKFEDLTSPPAAVAKANRLSCDGQSRFYASFDPNTSIEEIRHYLTNKATPIYLGEFETCLPLKVIDLTKLPRPDFWMEGEDAWQTFVFLHKFSTLIAQPINSTHANIEYLPTQVFANHLYNHEKSSIGQRFDGIVYQSSLTGKRNIILYYDQSASSRVERLNKVTEY